MDTSGDRRTWSDAQLCKAVETSQSWRTVARALGLKGTSAGVLRTLKRHVARLELGLDCTHLKIYVDAYAPYRVGDVSSLMS